MERTEVNDELKDLQPCDPFFPPDANSPGRLEIVPVHDHVDKEIEGDGDPRNGSEADQLGVAEKCRSSMMVCM